MKRKSFLMLATALVLGAGAVHGAGVAMAQMPGPMGARGGASAAAPLYDPAQLPQVKGIVAQYSLTPFGSVDGLILTDGTEVHLPPFVAAQLVFAVKPGDAVTIHGLKAQAVPMVMGRSVKNDATGATVLVTMPNWRGGGGTASLEAAGKVTALLHSPRGEANGVRLEDGTLVRMPPGEAKRLADLLTPGNSITVRGEGYAGPLGRVVAARQLGADKDSLKEVAGPKPGERRFGPGGHHGQRHGGMHGMDGGEGQSDRPMMQRRGG